MMDCWQVGDEGIFIRLEPDSRCDEDGTIYVLVDGFGAVERCWVDADGHEGHVEIRTRYEIEDDSFVVITEEIFPSGRTNYDREIELDDLEVLAAGDEPDETTLRLGVERFLSKRRL